MKAGGENDSGRSRHEKGVSSDLGMGAGNADGLRQDGAQALDGWPEGASGQRLTSIFGDDKRQPGVKARASQKMRPGSPNTACHRQ